MRKRRVEGFLAVQVKLLRDDRDDSHQDSEEAVLKNAHPDDLAPMLAQLVSRKSWLVGTHVEPCQTTARCPPNALLSTRTLLKPRDRPDPRFGFDSTEVFFLAMQVGRNVCAHKREESRNRKRFITVADQIIVDIVLVEVGTEPCDDGINGDHKQDSNDTSEGKRKSAISKRLSASE
mgnify:CR=1 FL=1